MDKINNINIEKLSIYNNQKIIITNYKEINYVSEEKIIIDKYIIIGFDLKIRSLDGYMMKIEGIIREIKYDALYN